MKLIAWICLLVPWSLFANNEEYQDDWLAVGFRMMPIECFSPDEEIQIINSVEEYRRLRQENQWSDLACDSYVAPEIDFTKWTLIHVTAHLGGPPPKTTLRVLKNLRSGEVKVTFTATRINIQRNYRITKKWYIIEKSETDKIDIEVVVDGP